MRIPESVIEEISRKIDIVELIGRHVRLTQKGSRYMGLCPFHSEKTPSFSVNQEIGAYYCFGCHKKGSAFTFLMDLEGYTFPDAVRELGRQVGVEVETTEDDDAGKERRALIELSNRVSKSFNHLLRENESGRKAREVLENRGITQESIESFTLGYAPADAFWLHGFLTSHGYSAAFLENSGLFTRRNPRRALFADRLMFPIRDARADVVAFGGRLLSGDGPKYINSPETPVYRKRELIYGIDLALATIRRAKTVVLAEGYMDVIALHQAGATGAVAPLGTAFTREQARLLSRYVDTAVVVFDGDRAGLAATVKAAEELERAGIDATVAPMESGSDPAELLQTRGSQAVMNAVSSPLTIVDYLVRNRADEAASTPESKAKDLGAIFPYLAAIKSEIRQDESLRLAADLIGADVEGVRAEFSRFRKGSKPLLHTERNNPRGSEEPGPTPELTYDLYLMLVTVRSRGHFAFVRQWVGPDDLVDPIATEVYLALEESYRQGEASLEALLERMPSSRIRDFVRERIAQGEFEDIGDNAVREAVYSVRRRTLAARRADVEARLRAQSRAERRDENAELELLAEKMNLDQELEKLKGEG